MFGIRTCIHQTRPQLGVARLASWPQSCCSLFHTQWPWTGTTGTGTGNGTTGTGIYGTGTYGTGIMVLVLMVLALLLILTNVLNHGHRWALGIVLYVMLVGKSPFYGGSHTTLFRDIIKKDVFFPADKV